MPKVFEVEGFRGFFYSNEGSPQEPVHIHVKKGEAKFWITPDITLVESWKLKVSELSRAEEIVTAHRQQILDLWASYFRINP